jgi:predicted ATPase
LWSAFEAVAKHGTTEFLLVSGSSGMGKSAIVKELDRALGLRPGMFVSGKFDQYTGHVPYAPLSQAFAMLVRNLLITPEAELALWRDALTQALGDHARLICELRRIMHDSTP